VTCFTLQASSAGVHREEAVSLPNPALTDCVRSLSAQKIFALNRASRVALDLAD
jgi:hypothetical protein